MVSLCYNHVRQSAVFWLSQKKFCRRLSTMTKAYVSLINVFVDHGRVCVDVVFVDAADGSELPTRSYRLARGTTMRSVFDALLDVDAERVND